MPGGHQGLNKRHILVLLPRLLVFSCSVVSDSFATPWTVAHQAPLSMGFSRQESWSGLPFPSPGAIPDSGIERPTLASPALTGSSLQLALPGKHWGYCWKDWIRVFIEAICTVSGPSIRLSGHERVFSFPPYNSGFSRVSHIHVAEVLGSHCLIKASR